jgi:hypothetical protein
MWPVSVGVPASSLGSLPIFRQIRVRVAKDFVYCLAIIRRKVLKCFASILAGQDVPQPLVNLVLDLRMQRAKSMGANQVAARILKNAALKIKFSQRASSFVLGPESSKFFGKVRRAFLLPANLH